MVLPHGTSLNMECTSIPARSLLTIISTQQTTIAPLWTSDDEMISISLVQTQLSPQYCMCVCVCVCGRCGGCFWWGLGFGTCESLPGQVCSALIEQTKPFYSLEWGQSGGADTNIGHVSNKLEIVHLLSLIKKNFWDNKVMWLQFIA